MPAETYAYSGQWRRAQSVYYNNNGTWLDLREIWKNDGGTWRLVFTKLYGFNDSISGYNYNLYNSARASGWDGVTPITSNITISGNLGATSVGVAAFDTGPMPAGCQINLFVNAGTGIVGAGGAGGYGGTYVKSQVNIANSTPGQDGGPGIIARCPITIYNNGIIGGGGGGGGGGAGAGGGQGYDDPGGGGGGGAGIIQGPGGGSWRGGSYIGTTGLIGKGGAGGFPSNQGSKEWAQATAGGQGGNMGQPGAASAASNGGPGFPGGAAGYSIINSGYVSWQVYGDVRGPLA